MFSFLIPDFLILTYFFSQLGDYQKAFEHLGKALTYDQGNYKVSGGVEMNQLTSRN